MQYLSSDLIILEKSEDIKLSPNFSSKEFNCSCSTCKNTILNLKLIEKLQKVRDELLKNLKINSGFRCEHKQDELRNSGYETSAGPSTHNFGCAADISVDGMTGDEIEAIAKKYFKAIGVARTFCHVDLREDKERRWRYK